MSVRFVQYLKASGLISVVVSVMLTTDRAVQLRKASLSILLTFLGTLKFFSPQSAKAPGPMATISASLSKLTVSRLLQPPKALVPMAVTDLGKLNVLRSLRPTKALSWIWVNAHSPRKLKAFSFVLVLRACDLMVLSVAPAGILTVSRLLHK